MAEYRRGQFGPLFDAMADLHSKKPSSGKKFYQYSGPSGLGPYVQRTKSDNLFEPPKPIANPEMFVSLEHPNDKIIIKTIIRDPQIDEIPIQEPAIKDSLVEDPPITEPLVILQRQRSRPRRLPQNRKGGPEPEIVPDLEAASQPPEQSPIVEESIPPEPPQELVPAKHPYLRALGSLSPSEPKNVFDLLDKKSSLILKWSLGIGTRKLPPATIGQYLGLSLDEVIERFGNAINSIQKHSDDHCLEIPTEISSLLQA